MQKYFLLLLFMFQFLIGISQSENYTTTAIFGTEYYHSISVGISFGPEHSAGFPKIAYSLQSGKNKGFYAQLHIATALGFTLSPGVEIGYRYHYIGAGYSFSFLGIDNNNAYYKWSHNVNTQVMIGPVLAKIGTPIYYIKKGKDFDVFFNDFVKFKQKPLNLELLFHDHIKKKK
ncbi:MAG TPA: hypothetical protein VK169_09425 [Saprospiraceae bacterium]|nr:hypothetical protein [Saprospiraceae bacterium]